MRHEAILSFAVAAGSLGKHYLSRHMLDELLLEDPEPKTLVPILIQLSIVWRDLGSPVAALAFLDSAATYARADEPRQQGFVLHQRAQLLIDRRQFAAAAKSLASAVKHYRRANKPHDEGRALLSIARLKLESGQTKAALAAARVAEKFAVKHRTNRIRLCALVDRARAHVALGAADEAKQTLRMVSQIPTGTDQGCLYAHFYLWQAERLAGNAGRAAIELREASHYVKFVDRDSAESKLLRQEMAATPQHPSSFAARLRRRGLDRDQARKPRRSRGSDGARRL
jgi:tetratricopeptide (TPR) repeat protein